MNNKEFLSEIATRLSISQKDCSNLMESLIGSVVTEFESGNSVSLQGFGTFEVRKKEQRLSVNPKTKQKMMIPPKLVLSFKSSNTELQRRLERDQRFILHEHAPALLRRGDPQRRTDHPRRESPLPLFR